MGLRHTFTTSILAVTTVLMLVAAGPGAALLEAPPSSRPDHRMVEGTALGPAAPSSPPHPAPSSSVSASPPGFHEDFAAWNAWTHQEPLPRLIHHARENAPIQGQMLLPKPDAYPGYTAAEPERQREAWRSWWLATELAAMRSPSVALDPNGANPYAHHNDQDTHADYQQQGIVASGEDDPITSPLGDPHGLERLWRLQAHGAPRITLPADTGEEMYIVTDRGVLFLSEPGEQPDWMLNVEGVASHAELIERDTGRNDLVVGMHTGGFDDTSASIWVIDGQEERITFQGLRGERSLLHWTLTDVDGDGEQDILGIDRSGNITAIKLDGTEIYRVPVPQPDLPEASLPGQSLPDPLPDLEEFPVLALVRTGMDVFGDATGDGTMDIFATSYWGFALFSQTAWVTLVEGASGEVVWTYTLDPMPEAQFRFTTPTITGDLTGDGHADVGIQDFGQRLFASALHFHNIYLSGETGTVFARDVGSAFSELQLFAEETPVEGVPELRNYAALAITDLDGNGENMIVTITTKGPITDERPVVQVREVPPTGGTSVVRDEYVLEIDAPWGLHHRWVDASLRHVDGAPMFSFLVHSWITSEGDPGALFTLTRDGFKEIPLDAPIGHFDINPQTGQRFAWTLADDRWTPVDAQMQPMGDGTRLIMNADPLISHSLGGAVPDLLIPRTLGYFWISGRTGAIMSEVERPPQTVTITGVEHQGHALVLELAQDAYRVIDVRAETEIGTVAQSDVPGDAAYRFLADTTGDGALELVFREFGWSFTVCDPVCREESQPDRWHFFTLNGTRPMWTLEEDHMDVVLGDVLQERDGEEVLTLVPEGSPWMPENVEVALYTGDDQSQLWSRTMDHVDAVLLEAGHVVLVTRDENWEQSLNILDAEDGSVVWQKSIDDDSQLVWLRAAGLDGEAPLLVQSYEQGHYNDPDGIEQSVVVNRIDDPEEVSRFVLPEPRVEERIVHFGAFTHTHVIIDYAQPGPVLGDWNGDGYPDMALREGGWPSVRSLKDGSVLAVGTLPGSFNRAIDLNQDGRCEVGMLSGGSLRMFAYNPERTQLDREDPMERVDAVNPDEGDPNATAFFDRDEERTPGPAPVLVVGFIAAAAWVLRRMNSLERPRL